MDPCTAPCCTGTAEEIAAMDAEDQARHGRLSAPDALLKAALWYAERDIRVFPCQPRGKRPIITTGLHGATVDPDLIRQWWTATPQANIGAPTGHRFDVIDVDGWAGVQSLIPFMDQIRAEAIGVVDTPRPGGTHWYMPPREDGRNNAKKRPGVDRRGLGGYVILPPSVTDEHGPGRRYYWTRPLELP